MSVIEVGNGSFIAGEAAPLPNGYAPCGYCGGDGLGYDFDGYLEVCNCEGGYGSGVGRRLHPLVPVVADPYGGEAA